MIPELMWTFWIFDLWIITIIVTVLLVIVAILTGIHTVEKTLSQLTKRK